MSRQTEALTALAQRAQVALRETHEAREKALPLGRGVIRLSANAIRAVHRKDLPQARSLLEEAQASIDRIRQDLQGHADIYNAGYVQDAQKEYSEAWATLAFAAGEPLKAPEELRVEMAPYLNGLAEAASELRRSILDALRIDDVGPCEEWMQVMDEVYSLLVTIDFPEAVTAGLRRTTDQLRGVLERTRGDLTMALRQRSLERRLSEFQERLDSHQG